MKTNIKKTVVEGVDIKKQKLILFTLLLIV